VSVRQPDRIVRAARLGLTIPACARQAQCVCTSPSVLPGPRARPLDERFTHRGRDCHGPSLRNYDGSRAGCHSPGRLRYAPEANW
jgi:hypothetical protein